MTSVNGKTKHRLNTLLRLFQKDALPIGVVEEAPLGTVFTDNVDNRHDMPVATKLDRYVGVVNAEGEPGLYYLMSCRTKASLGDNLAAFSSESFVTAYDLDDERELYPEWIVRVKFS